MNEDVLITPDPEYRKVLLDAQRSRMGTGQRREGVHVSDLLMCVRKAWAERQSSYVLDPPDQTVLTWLRGLSHEDLLADGITQVRSGYCFPCKTNWPWDSHVAETGTCPTCQDTLLTGTIDWVDIASDLNDFLPIEMKSTLKSSRKTLDDMAWYVDQIKSYMAMHGRDEGRVAILHIMGDYSRADKDVRNDGPEAELKVYRISWRDSSARNNWLVTLQMRKRMLEDNQHMPGLGISSPAHEMICDYCAIGEKLPSGEECERWPWRSLSDGTYVRKGSNKQDLSMGDMLRELQEISEKGIVKLS